jgi:Protein of unknown function (DUF4236)
MGWRIRRSKGLLGGLVRTNLSKSGIGISVGVKGARIGINSKAQKYSLLSIPHAGIYRRDYYPERSTSHKRLAQAPIKFSIFFIAFAVTLIAMFVFFLLAN